MLLIVRILLWSLLISILLIPLVRWFWKYWDSPSKEAMDYLEELKEEEEEQRIWQEAEEYDAAVREVEEKWIKSPETSAPSEDVKAVAMATLTDAEEEIESQGPSEPPDEQAATAAKQVVVESEDIGKGTRWRLRSKAADDDWRDVEW